jgi:signal transduction histidine kinase
VEDRERIFERFYRGDRSRFRLPKAGAGLGLAISRALARRQGGDLTVASSPGEGSTFVLRLPGGRRP